MLGAGCGNSASPPATNSNTAQVEIPETVRQKSAQAAAAQAAQKASENSR